jgi:hypothetical protein
MILNDQNVPSVPEEKSYIIMRLNSKHGGESLSHVFYRGPANQLSGKENRGICTMSMPMHGSLFPVQCGSFYVERGLKQARKTSFPAQRKVFLHLHVVIKKHLENLMHRHQINLHKMRPLLFFTDRVRFLLYTGCGR